MYATIAPIASSKSQYRAVQAILEKEKTAKEMQPTNEKFTKKQQFYIKKATRQQEVKYE